MKLHDYLTAKKLDVAEFAGAAGLSAIAIYKYLSGERTPRQPALDKIFIASEGKVTANDFFPPPTHTNGKHRRKEAP